jgi:hypothetical protein
VGYLRVREEKEIETNYLKKENRYYEDDDPNRV